MPVTLTINGHRDRRRRRACRSSTAPSRPACACRRPASSRASARSASSRSPRGWSCCRRRPERDGISTQGNFRLSCQCRVAADAGEVECHTMRRGQMRIERHALDLPVSAQDDRARSGRDARRRSHPDSTARRSTRSTGPIHGLAMDLGTTTIVLRLFDLETGELVADASFENPQRFGGSDVMSRIHYDTEHPRQAADAHARRLSDATRSRTSRSIRRRSTKWSSSATRRCAICSSARACTRSGRTRIARSPRSRWRRASARRPA